MRVSDHQRRLVVRAGVSEVQRGAWWALYPVDCAPRLLTPVTVDGIRHCAMHFTEYRIYIEAIIKTVKSSAHE